MSEVGFLTSKTGYAPDMSSKSRRAARAMFWAWIEVSRTIGSLQECLKLVDQATEEEQDALIVARGIDDRYTAGSIIDAIRKRVYRFPQ